MHDQVDSNGIVPRFRDPYASSSEPPWALLQAISSRRGSMLPYGEDAVLIGTGERGMFLLDKNGIEPFPTRHDLLRKSNIYGGTVLRDSTYALATVQAGILVMDSQGRLLQHLHLANGLMDDLVTTLFVDRQQALWAGTNQGPSRIDYPSRVSFYDKRQGVEGLGICAEGHRGQIYLGTTSGLFVSDSGDSRFYHVDGAGPSCRPGIARLRHIWWVCWP